MLELLLYIFMFIHLYIKCPRLSRGLNERPTLTNCRQSATNSWWQSTERFAVAALIQFDDVQLNVRQVAAQCSRRTPRRSSFGAYTHNNIIPIWVYDSLQKIRKLQSMNYAIYIKYKIRIWLFEHFQKCPTNSKKSNVFWCCWSILYNKLVFWISYSDALYWTLYGKIG